MQKTICCKGKLLSLEKPLIMGILNVTADSFYDGGRYLEDGAMLQQAEKLLSEGADILDIGCVSTRPGAADMPEADELRVAEHAVQQILAHFPEAVISVDTWRASVARRCAGAGASLINDISGGEFDAEMFPTIAALQLPYILMHTPSKPGDMQQHTAYTDIVQSVYLYLSTRLQQLRRLNVKDVILDVGFCFGKTVEQNYTLLQHFRVFRTLDCPLLCALSRKSMLYKTIGGTPADALQATVAAHVLALQQGAGLLRVHDVKAARDAIAVFSAAAGQ